FAIDCAFFGANIIKIAHGGWVALAIGGGVFLLMSTWSRGTDLLRRFLAQVAVPMDRFLDEVERTKPPRVRGTAVFLTHDVDGAVEDAPIQLHGAQRECGDRLLQHPAKPGRRARRAYRVLSLRQLAPMFGHQHSRPSPRHARMRFRDAARASPAVRRGAVVHS